jgi:hypothetical protein
MNRIVSALKATYDFFAGDAILLGAVALAFVLGSVLERVTHAPNALTAACFIALLVGGLVATLGRELRGRPRQR